MFIDISQLIGLTYVSEASARSQLLLSLLSDMQQKIPLLDTSEVCSVAECMYELKQRSNADNLHDNPDSDEGRNSELYFDLIETMLSILAVHFKTQYSTFSMREMKSLVRFYEPSHFISDLIYHEAHDRMSRVKGEFLVRGEDTRNKQDINEDNFEKDANFEDQQQHPKQNLENETQDIPANPPKMLGGETLSIDTKCILKAKEMAFDLGFIQQQVVKEDPCDNHKVQKSLSCFELFP